MLELLALLQPEALHDFCHPIVRAEVAHQLVLDTDVKPRGARVALTRAAPAYLPINPARSVPLGSDNHQTAQLRHPWTELNIGAATSHVRGNRDRARLTGAGHDLSLLHVKFRIQHVMRNFLALQHS